MAVVEVRRCFYCDGCSAGCLNADSSLSVNIGKANAPAVSWKHAELDASKCNSSLCQARTVRKAWLDAPWWPSRCFPTPNIAPAEQSWRDELSLQPPLFQEAGKQTASPRKKKVSQWKMSIFSAELRCFEELRHVLPPSCGWSEIPLYCVLTRWIPSKITTKEAPFHEAWQVSCQFTISNLYVPDWLQARVRSWNGSFCFVLNAVTCHELLTWAYILTRTCYASNRLVLLSKYLHAVALRFTRSFCTVKKKVRPQSQTRTITIKKKNNSNNTVIDLRTQRGVCDLTDLFLIDLHCHVKPPCNHRYIEVSIWVLWPFQDTRTHHKN